MFSTLRTRFGIPGVISVIALVFAMFGGAYAASNSASGGKATVSAKAKKGSRGPKGPKGDTGPAGATGPAGPAGAAGKDGANGTNGKDGAPGAPGTSVTTASILTTSATCNHNGGVEVKSASPTQNVCNGETGFTSTLPSGKTEKGTWVYSPVGGEDSGEDFFQQKSGWVPISFPIPLASGVAVHLMKEGAAPTPECPGASSEEPIAAKGNLCLYQSPVFAEFSLEGARNPETGNSEFGAITTGKVGIELFIEGEESVFGVWAATAP